MTWTSAKRWRVPPDQRLIFEDFDDGIVMFDAKVGATHLLNASAAETLAIIQDAPGIATDDVHIRVLDHLGITAEALPLTALHELLRRLEDLSLIAGDQ